MKAKLSLLLALAHNPRILLLDEPSASLDPLSRWEFLQLLLNELGGDQRTIIMSSHRIDELSTYAQRICFLDAGTVFYEGTPQGIVTRFRGLPATAESQETFYKEHPKIDWIDLLNSRHSANRALPVAILHPPLVTQPLIVLYGTPQTFDTLSQEGAELMPLGREQIFLAVFAK